MEEESNSEEELKWFNCKICGIKEVYTTKEKKPKFLQNISFSNNCYVMKDPFSPPEKKQFLVLGGDCFSCKQPVCQAPECSIFYKERFCQNCAWKKKNDFPQQLQAKIKEPKN